MDTDDYGNPGTFSLVSPGGQSFHLFSQISQHLFEVLAQTLAETFIGPIG